MTLTSRRALLVAVILAVCSGASAACAGELIFGDDFETGRSCAWAFGTPTCPGFQIQTPPIAVPAGDEFYVCYYFRTPNVATLGIRRWASTMSQGVAHMVAYGTYDVTWVPIDRQPPGTVTQAPCGFTEGGGYDGWLYAAHAPEEELAIPADDGSGTALAVEIPAGTPAYIQMRMTNDSLEPIQASVTLGAEALDPGEPYTKTASYLASNFLFALPSGIHVRQETCSTAPGAKFWWFSTHTNRNGIGARVLDAGSPLVETTGWESPAATVLASPNFHGFSANSLTYECTWDNQTGDVLTFGDDEMTDENCFGVGYFFPATRPTICSTNGAPL